MTILLITLTLLVLVLLFACLGMANALKRIDAEQQGQRAILDLHTHTLDRHETIVQSTNDIGFALLRVYPLTTEDHARLIQRLRIQQAGAETPKGPSH